MTDQLPLTAKFGERGQRESQGFGAGAIALASPHDNEQMIGGWLR
jgi:hypothetical protein